MTIRLGFTPVPITGQTFAVLLGAEVLGWKRGAAGMALYAAAGVAALPWFAGHAGGPSMLASPSFGYEALALPTSPRQRSEGGWPGGTSSGCTSGVTKTYPSKEAIFSAHAVVWSWR